MGNPATEKMLLAVQTTKESARRAEEEYDRQASRLQMQAGNDIDLFGGRVTSQVADLVVTSKKICDSLYAAYQTLVKMLDVQCRPLIDQEPELAAVRAVRDLIKWLNDESEIENNFTASFNARDLGDVASVRYLPSLENKMIQSYWESAYHGLPCRAAMEQEEYSAEARAKKEAAAARKAQYEESQKKAAAAKAQYLSDMEAWRAAVAEVERQRTAMLNNLTAQERKHWEGLAEDNYKAAVSRAEADKVRHTAERAQAQETLSSLGFFQFGEKSRLKKQVEALNEQILEDIQTLQKARNAKEREIFEITGKISQKKAQWQNAAEQAYPLPEEPCPPGMSPQQLASQKLQDAIYDTLRKHKRLSTEDIQQKCPAAKDLTDIRLRAILRQMEGRVMQEELKYKIYYSALPAKTPEQISQENSEYMEAIYNYVRSVDRCTVGQIHENCLKVMHLPIQRVSSLTNLLHAQGRLHRTEHDRKAFFEIV